MLLQQINTNLAIKFYLLIFLAHRKIKSSRFLTYPFENTFFVFFKKFRVVHIQGVDIYRYNTTASCLSNLSEAEQLLKTCLVGNFSLTVKQLLAHSMLLALWMIETLREVHRFSECL